MSRYNPENPTASKPCALPIHSIAPALPHRVRKHYRVYKLSGLLIVTLYLGWMPAPAQAAKQEKTTKASKAAQVPKAGKVFRDCPDCPEMIVIPAGSFSMGSLKSENGRNDDEEPVHQVQVTAFALGKTEIARGQFAAFVKQTQYDAGDKCWTIEGGKYEERGERNWRNPGYPQNDKHPVTCINWNDAQEYATWLSGKTGKKYRLPTEAEWEYVARGKTSTARYWGGNPNEACGYANTADQTTQTQVQGAAYWSVHRCSDGFAYTSPTGSFKANAFGLKDMLGNVWEWTADNYHDNYDAAPTDGSAWSGNDAKYVLRGGSWNNDPGNVRTAIRNRNWPATRFNSFGFRLARTLP